MAQHQYVLATEEAEAALQDKALEQADKWGRVQERYAKQARNHAADLGLTVTARCRLVIPNTGAAGAGEEENPFMQLLKGGRARDA